MTNNLAGINEGVLLVDKPRGKTSFSLVTQLRRLTRISKKSAMPEHSILSQQASWSCSSEKFTHLSNHYLAKKKNIAAQFSSASTDSYDCDGKLLPPPCCPTLAEIESR